MFVTTRLASIVHASEICGFPVNASNAATVVTAAGAALAAHPAMVVGVILPVTEGAVLSSMLIVWTMLTLVLRQTSVTLYVRVITIGQVPAIVCIFVNTRFGSVVHASEIWRVPGNASRAETVVTAAGAAAIEQPSIFVTDKLPVTPGATLSSTLMVCRISTLVLRHRSVTLYVLVITIGQVPVDVCVLLTTRLPSIVQASVIWRFPGKASNAATVVAAAGAEETEHPSIFVTLRLPVTAGARLSSTFKVWMMFTLVLRQGSVTL